MLASSLQLIARRSVAHWRLLSAVVAGVMLAVTVMASTVIYFDSLRNLALDHAFSRVAEQDLDVTLRARLNGLDRNSHSELLGSVDRSVDESVGGFLDGRQLAMRTETFDYEAIDAPAAPDDEGPARRVALAASPGIMDHVRFTSGGPPSAAGGAPAGEPLRPEIMIPAATADQFDLQVGDTFRAVPFWQEENPAPMPVISGVFERVNPADDFWRLFDAQFDYSSGSFMFLFGYVTEEALVDTVAGHYTETGARYAWRLDVNPDLINASQANGVVASLESMETELAADVDGFRVLTSLSDVISGFETQLFFNRLPMIIVLILVVMVVLYYAVTLATLLVHSQREEIGLIRTRGGTSGQILGIYVIEAAVLSGAAVAIGPVLAALATRFAGVLPWFSAINDGQPLPVTLGWDAYQMAALGGALSFAALFYPAYRASRTGLLAQRRSSARSTGPPAFQRYYLDLVVLGVVALLLRQLQAQGSVAAENLAGEQTVNQVTLAIPALFMLAAGIVLLRLFPLAMDLLGRAFSSRFLYRLVSPTLVLGLWQMARNPAHYSRLSLLFILTSGLGVFAANFGATLDRSALERVMYDTGADLRINGLDAANNGTTGVLESITEEVEGVQRAAPALRHDGIVRGGTLRGGSYTMLAVDPERMPEVAWTRPDLVDGTLASQLDFVDSSFDYGIPLPEDARYLTMRVNPEASAPDAVLEATYRDANGRYYQSRLGNLRPSPETSSLDCPEAAAVEAGDPVSWCRIGGDVLSVSGRRQGLRPEAPLELVSISVLNDRPLNGDALPPDSALIDDISAVRDNGESVTLLDFEAEEDFSMWKKPIEARETVNDSLRQAVDSEGNEMPGIARLGWDALGPGQTVTFYPGEDAPHIPVLASEMFLDETGRQVGDTMLVTQEQRIPLRLRIEDTVRFFPSLNPNAEPFLIADIEPVLAQANLGRRGLDIQPNEVWLETVGDASQGVESEAGGVPPAVAEWLGDNGFEFNSLSNRAGDVQDISVDPLVRSGWSVLLGLAFGTVLLVSAVGFIVHALVSFQSRKGEFALLRTIGLTMRQLISLVVLEQILVIGAAIAIGVFMGAQMGSAIMPYLSNAGEGVQVVPPMVIEVDWAAVGATFGILGGVILLVMAFVVLSVYRMSIQSVLRLGDR